ncbi:MAG TPA: hypothetical protein VNQ77_07255 [Frankiaceae bacterium]|nr:hypothetical protein [Frankiaceae bacterium]
MRKAILRCAAVAATAVLTTTLLPASTAVAATSDDCRATESTRLFTGGLNEQPDDRVWIDSQSSTRTVVCVRWTWVQVPLGGLTIIADVASGGTLPDVDVDDDASLCPTVLATVADPVPVQISIGLAASAVCVKTGTTTMSIQFLEGNVGPSTLPVLEVWRDGGADWGYFDVAACPVEFALAVAIQEPTDCMETNDRLFP